MWIKELKTYANPDIKIFLIGNKLDLENNREVSTEEAQKLKEEYELNLYLETSAKSGFNAQKIFIEAAEILYQEYKDYKNIKKYEFNKKINLGEIREIPLNDNIGKSKCGC